MKNELEVIDVVEVLDHCPADFVDDTITNKSINVNLEFILFFCNGCIHHFNCQSRCKDCQSALNSYKRVKMS